MNTFVIVLSVFCIVAVLYDVVRLTKIRVFAAACVVIVAIASLIVLVPAVKTSVQAQIETRRFHVTSKIPESLRPTN